MSYNVKKLSESSLYRFFNLSTKNEGVKRTLRRSANEETTSRREFIDTIFNTLSIDKNELELAKARNKSDKMQDITAMSDKLNSFTDQAVWQIPLEEFNEKIESFESSIDNSDEFDISTVSESIKPAVRQIEKLYKESASLKNKIKKRTDLHETIISKLDGLRLLEVEGKDLLKQNARKFLEDASKKASTLSEDIDKDIESAEAKLADSKSMMSQIENKIAEEDRLIENEQKEYFSLVEKKRSLETLANQTRARADRVNLINHENKIENAVYAIIKGKETLKLYRIESILYENINKICNVLIEILKIKKKINEQKEKIKVLFDNKEAQITKTAEREEIKKLIGNIENESLIEQLYKKFEESKSSVEDFKDYHVSEILQSCLINAVNTIEINEQLALIKSSDDSIKIITNTDANKTSNSITANDDKFGLVSSEFLHNNPGDKIFNINDIIYGDSKTIDRPIATKSQFSKKNPLMSHIMVLDPDINVSNRNELELSLFLNVLSNLDLNKATPYLNVMFLLPDSVLKNGKIYKTASITQFLSGKTEETKIQSGLNSSFNKERGPDKKVYSGIKSNMSLFTSPQTLNNFDEVFIGRQSDKEKLLNEKVYGYTRANNINDITRPFMTIKSFNIDVAPTQGLLSMKTGKVSLVIHDRTRMSEIAPFIKPDMLGAFGSEIILSYGWNSMDDSLVGEFINDLKVNEKYIITNSSFSITKNGEVNVDLSIAMRGPIDIKNTFLSLDVETKINIDKLNNIYKSIDEIKKKLLYNEDGSKQIEIKESLVENIYMRLISGKSEKEIIKNANSFSDIVRYIDTLDLPFNKNYKARADAFNAMFATLDDNQSKIDVFKQELDKLLNTKSDLYKAVSSTININTDTVIGFDLNNLPSKVNELINNLMINYMHFLISTKEFIEEAKIKKESANSFVLKNIIKPLGYVDPFYDKDWSAKYNKLQQTISGNMTYESSLMSEDVSTSESLGIPYHSELMSENEFSSRVSGSKSEFISFGTFLSAILGSHMKDTGIYDDIQIITYSVNKNAGLMSNKNISSLLINKDILKDFAIDLFNSRSKISLEGFIAKVIEDQIIKSSQVCYGISDLYADENIAIKEDSINERLETINKILEKAGDSESIFQIPRIKMFFDTFVNKEEADRTILRVSVYDENNNPYAPVRDIFMNDNNLLNVQKKLSSLKIKGKSVYGQKAYEIFDTLIKEGIIKNIYSADENVISNLSLKKQILAKKEIKKLAPSVTYGSQNSTVIDANVTTINEGNLSTVLMTRNDREKGKVSNVKITSDEDLPLQIFPSKATVTMFGCPIVNFAQYLFLDFETGTTIDNFYSVTGISHSLTPGSFKTTLTLSYGDAYGKYRSASSSVKQLVEDVIKGKVKRTYTINSFITSDNFKNNNNVFIPIGKEINKGSF